MKMNHLRKYMFFSLSFVSIVWPFVIFLAWTCSVWHNISPGTELVIFRNFEWLNERKSSFSQIGPIKGWQLQFTKSFFFFFTVRCCLSFYYLRFHFSKSTYHFCTERLFAFCLFNSSKRKLSIAVICGWELGLIFHNFFRSLLSAVFKKSNKTQIKSGY